MGQMIEQGETVGDVEGVMIRDADDAGAEHDPPGARRGDRHEDFGRRDYFPSRRMMLADERLFVAERVEPLDQLQVAFEAERRVFADAVERGDENSELHHSSLVGQGLSRPPWPTAGLSGYDEIRTRNRAGTGWIARPP